jgi:uncharacterized repeat protein (TIGR01451 family)
VFSVFAAAAVALASDSLTGNIEALKVLVAEKNGEESFVPAGEAYPRDVIEYRLHYANRGESALRAIAITDPIPVGTEYVVSTAQQSSDARVSFSIDSGKSFHAWPVRMRKVVEGKETWVDAPASMVTHIRWTLNDSLAPAEEVQLAYRTVVR